jgi:site-specific DNA recombinase
MLQNRLYRGEIPHQSAAYPGQHPPIVEDGLWRRAQEKLADNRRGRDLKTNVEAPSPLAGLVYDAAGERMTPTHANKGAKRYRYYVSASLIVKEGRGDEARPAGRSEAMRVPAGNLEALTLDRLRAFLGSQQELADGLDGAGLDAKALDAALNRAAGIAHNWRAQTRAKTIALLRTIIERVVVEKNRVTIEMSPEGLLSALGAMPQSELPSHRHSEPITLTFEMALRRAGKEKRLVIGGANDQNLNPALIALIAKSITIRDELFSGSDPSVEAMTERLSVAKGYVASLIRLSYLSPAMVGEILDGRQPLDLTPTRLLKLSQNLPQDWLEQNRYLGFPG